MTSGLQHRDMGAMQSKRKPDFAQGPCFEADAVHFREACCASGKGRFMPLRDFHNAFYNWLYHLYGGCEWDREDAMDVMRAVESYRPFNSGLEWSAGRPRDVMLLGCSLEVFPTACVVKEKMATSEALST